MKRVIILTSIISLFLFTGSSMKANDRNGDKIDKKEANLNQDLSKEEEASKNNRFVILDLDDVFPSLNFINVLEILREEFQK